MQNDTSYFQGLMNATPAQLLSNLGIENTLAMNLTEPSENLQVTNTLNERGSTHGDFRTQAARSNLIAESLHSSRNWDDLPAYAKHALEMVSTKLGRILSGDWSYADHWHDIAGYATLVEQELTKRNEVCS